MNELPEMDCHLVGVINAEIKQKANKSGITDQYHIILL